MRLTIGHKLLAIREERQMTQAEMAHLLDIPDATYSRYERNESQVSYDKLVKFAESLKIPIHELLPDTMSVQSNNNHNTGHAGGGLVFGTQNVYIGDSVSQSQLAKENEELKKKLSELEKKLEEVLGRL